MIAAKRHKKLKKQVDIRALCEKSAITARNKQAEACKPGVVLRVTNGKIDMFKGTMRQAVEKGGSVKPTEEQQVLVVNSGYDLSAVEYERISDY